MPFLKMLSRRKLIYNNTTCSIPSKLRIKLLATFLLVVFNPAKVNSQPNNFKSIRAEVHFDKTLRDWDGFGFNYVEEAQYRNIDSIRQEYGGFSYLSEKNKMEIIELVFGEDGLKPAIIKMFLDPFHQEKPGGPYNHRKTTKNMLFFVENGYKTTKNDGRDLEIISTLYGPPAYMTRQKEIRGRDFDNDHKTDLAEYLIDWAEFLTKKKQLPLKYISLNNEGDDWQRWPANGGDSEDHYNNDYNMYWPPELVVEFLKFLPEKLSDVGLGNIGLTPGECYGWDRFVDYGYAQKICADKEALGKLSLVTSHGFVNFGWGRWNPYHTSVGTDMIRVLKPGMKAWVTSTSWGSMDAFFIREIYGNIYDSKVNGIIPWAGIQRPGMWVGGDPNAGCAIHVFDNGTYEIRKGYYFYKQVSRAGQAGMAVASVISMDPQIKIIGFSSNGTSNPDAFVVINVSNEDKILNIKLAGHISGSFDVYRSTNDEVDLYKHLGNFHIENYVLDYTAPAGSVTSFFDTELRILN